MLTNIQSGPLQLRYDYLTEILNILPYAPVFDNDSERERSVSAFSSKFTHQIKKDNPPPSKIEKLAYLDNTLKEDIEKDYLVNL
jgi:hypothetical protein